MRLRECDGCEDQVAEHDLASMSGVWIQLADSHGWQADACSAACAQSVLLEHLQEVTELAVVRR